MANSLFEYHFQDDQQEKENSYPISDVQWMYINDINQNNYSNGFINFTNISIIGSSVTSQHILYYCTYYSVSFTCTVHCTYYTYCTLYI